MDALCIMRIQFDINRYILFHHEYVVAYSTRIVAQCLPVSDFNAHYGILISVSSSRMRVKPSDFLDWALVWCKESRQTLHTTPRQLWYGYLHVTQHSIS